MAASPRVKYPCGNRLAYHWQRADQRFWEDHWGELTSDSFRYAEHGCLDSLPATVLRWLPRNGKILEAGCGPGRVVVALRARGYDVEGVEWAADLVERVRALRPDLPIRTGDATALDVAENTYAACISLGVCEHREAGPEPFLREAFRILRPRGVLLISVPHYHWLRRALYARAVSPASRAALDFYKYAFRPDDFRALLERAGFAADSRTGYGVWYGLTDDIPGLKRLKKVPFLGGRWSTIGDRLPFLRRSLGHMQLFVAHKRASWLS